jgi:hypothetical protein
MPSAASKTVVVCSSSRRPQPYRPGFSILAACVATTLLCCAVGINRVRAAEVTIDDVDRVWQQRQAATKSARFEWIEHVVTPDRDARKRQTSADVRPHAPVVEALVSVLWLGDGPNMRHELQPPKDPADLEGTSMVRSESSASAYNGKRNTTLSTASRPEDWPKGVV